MTSRELQLHDAPTVKLDLKLSDDVDQLLHPWSGNVCRPHEKSGVGIDLLRQCRLRRLHVHAVRVLLAEALHWDCLKQVARLLDHRLLEIGVVLHQDLQLALYSVHNSTGLV